MRYGGYLLSIRYKVLSFGVRIMGIKKLFSLPKDELLKKVKKMNQKRIFQMLSDDDRFLYTDILVFDKYHCLKIQPKRKKAKKAILFLFGGGFLLGSDKGDLNVARDIVQKCNADVWFPYYPLCTEHNITESYKMVYHVYQIILQEYGADNIAFIGFSSGAALAIGVCLHNNAQEIPLPMPKLIVACSPGYVPLNNEELKEMEHLSKKDIMLDITFMKNIRDIMERGQQVPLYMLSGTRGDFSNFPITHFYYGSDEILYTAARHFQAAFNKYSAKCVMHVGHGMCHCFPMVQLFPEGKQAYQEIINLLAENTQP